MDWRIIEKIFWDIFKLDRIDYPECSVLTFACDNDRSITISGKKYAPLINTVEDALEKRGLQCTSISRIASRVRGALSHGRVFSPDGGFARAMILKRLKGLFLPAGAYPFSNLEKHVWDRILDQCKPRAVVGILPSRELCVACKQRGIWVADMQHGVIAETHHWYGGAYRSKEPAQWAPDAFLVWDEGSAEVLRAWAPNAGAAVEVIGNPWVDRFRKKDPGDAVYRELVERYPQVENGKPNILISLSWHALAIPNRFIHPALERFILETLDTYNWIVRLHPNQVQGFAANEADEFQTYLAATYPPGSLDWGLPTEMPLPLLLSRIDRHVTWNSSVCLEAASFGIRSLLMDPELLPGEKNGSYYSFLTDLGYTQKIRPEYDGVKAWFTDLDRAPLVPLAGHNGNFEKVMDSVSKLAGGCNSNLT